MIEIDGSYGEGGGQILRTALSLSSITQIPVRIKNIRIKRNPPGLRTQHLYAARAVRKICRGKLEGDEIGSKELTFYPGKIVGGKYHIKLSTAGSTTLITQTLIPILLFSKKKSKLIIEGGTFNPKAPTYDYFERVFLRMLNEIGITVNSKLIKPGYYPSGGGIIEVEIKPPSEEIPPFKLIRIEEEVKSIIRISNLPFHIALREKKVLVENSIDNVTIIEDKAKDKGNVMLIYSHLRGSIGFGEKSKRAEIVAQECIKNYKGENGAVDRHLADQALIYAALFGGYYTTSKITQHLISNKYVIEQFFNKEVNIKTVDNIVEIYFNK